jgi:hypothetical protein
LAGRTLQTLPLCAGEEQEDGDVDWQPPVAVEEWQRRGDWGCHVEGGWVGGEDEPTQPPAPVAAGEARLQLGWCCALVPPACGAFSTRSSATLEQRISITWVRPCRAHSRLMSTLSSSSSSFSLSEEEEEEQEEE